MGRGKVVIVGQGYVGLPLAAACVEAGWNTLGLEVNIDHLNSIRSGNHDLLSSRDKRVIAEGFSQDRYEVTDDFSKISGSGVVIYCLPTPLDEEKNPDLSILQDALNKTGPYIDDNALLILESTSFPGTTRNYFAGFLTENFENCRSCDFAFSPERIDPNNAAWNLRNIPKLVAGLNDEAKKRAVEFYEGILDMVVPVDSLEIAELAKLIENSYRLINISFINELQVTSNKLGIPLRKAIEAASTKPYGFQPFYPSAGIGGHCIPVDPVYLNWAAARIGFPLRMIERALQVNDEMPNFIVERFQQLYDRPPSRVVLAGIGYKPGVADLRESPAIEVAKRLQGLGCEIFWSDLHVKEWPKAQKLNPGTDKFNGLIILQEVDQDILQIALNSNIVILDCTGKYNYPGVTPL